MEKNLGVVGSSVNPGQLSATVSGAILTVSSLIIMVAGLAGFQLAETQVAEFAQQVGLAAGSLWFLYGVLRKIVVVISQRFS